MRGRKWLSAALLRMTAPSRFATALRALQVGMACGHGPPGLHSPTNSSRALSGDSSSKCRAVSARHAEMWITPEPSTTSVVFRPPPCIGVRCWGCRGAGTFRRPTTEWGGRLMLNDDLDGQRGAWHHPQVRYDRHAIRRRQFALRRRERCKRTMIRLCCMSVAVMFAAMMNWALLRVPSASAGEEVFAAVTLCAGRQAACRAVWLWPVGQPAVIADFDPPDRPWLSGHRGVDLQASDGDELYAPADGIISFAGSVGGKSVVSVNHGDLVSTFEPAHTEGVAGTAVRRGDVIGEVGGASDHCDGRCLHWGVRRVRLQNEGTATTYLDPLARVRPMRIGLKPD